ncbi:MAG: hypothetical protein AAGK21_04530 [Bacteroidota bacterium]
MPQTATRKTTKRRSPSKATSAKRARRGTGVVLPGWADLQPSKLAGGPKRAKAGAKKAASKAKSKRKARRPLDAVPSSRFGVSVVIGCVLLVLFLGHAYATRATLDALQDARRENDRLRLTHQRLQGDVDRMTGPTAIMRRAATIGLEEGAAYGPTIRLDD